jgi:hypothetical protein
MRLGLHKYRNMSEVQKIDLKDSLKEAIAKVCDGNPGAFSCLASLMDSVEEVDPESVLKIIGPLLQLDHLGIWGPNIWVLYKDVCSHNPARMLALLRGVQLGILSEEDIIFASKRIYKEGSDSKTLDVSDIYFKVKNKLKKFDANNLAGFEK